MSTSINSYDVIVVGGGPGGTYAAWRAMTGTASPTSPLPSNPAQRRVLLLESSGRIGGRLESIPAPGAPDLMAEFGGMGFTSKDKIFYALTDPANAVLPVTRTPFAMAANLTYVRGRQLTAQQAIDPTQLPYQMTPEEFGVIGGQWQPDQMGPGALVTWAAEKVIPGCAGFTPAQWAHAKRTVLFDGRHLRDIGFWNFLLMNMSNEAFCYVHDMFGHFFEVANWNCAEALPWFLGDGQPPYYTLVGGYDQLPKQMAAAFQKAGGELRLQTPVTQVTAAPGGGGLLVSMAGNAQALAKHVVLAMPRRALEMIAPGSVVLGTPEGQTLVKSVTGQRVMKLFLSFDTAWWAQMNPPITQGASSTDMPLGQCWYFTGANNGPSLLMASYNDTLSTSYWEGLASGPRYPTTAANPSPQWLAQAASQAMVQEVMRQLAILHGKTDIPAPTGAAYMNWARDPFGGAFHTWNVGVDAPEIEPKMLRPDPQTPLYVCGDAYSSDQGWTEGALATGEKVMRRYLGLTPPPWWPPAPPPPEPA